MKRISRFLTLAILGMFLCAGCASEALRQFLHKGEVAMSERFDFASVGSFLRGVIAEHPSFEGIRLSATRVKNEWRMGEGDYPHQIRSGDWLLDDRKGGDEFLLSYDASGERAVLITAKRSSRTQFVLLSISLEYIATAKLGKTESEQATTGNGGEGPVLFDPA